MDHFTLSLAVGAVAGVLDVLPMLFQRVAFRSCLSAFFVYLFSSVLVFHSTLPYLPWWAQGMVTTLMLAVPVVLTFAGRDRKSIPIVLANAVIFGFLISVAERYIG